MSPTAHTTAQRYPERVNYDRDAVYAILDEALAVHAGFATDDGPVVVPTLHMREVDQLLLHGSAFGRFMTTAAGGAPGRGERGAGPALGMKVRAGFARDQPKDDEIEAWVGYIPLTTTPGTPFPDAITGTRFIAPVYDPAVHCFRQNPCQAACRAHQHAAGCPSARCCAEGAA
ncbi:pyridoxamine 5'-phosphate oxidase family protein [Streptomyces sp. NBC_01283]|uniref:pyridoxamine 5'-phosphate oxidase family protein n=1 Tax=Streptomyces sp. NBC_01283 TaxID=2903812 RepID=UPI00352BE2E7|nr:pyridoxamine 5'-phosphate oxidase family protein [Streptomyces sp. NBC_01283]